MYGYKDIEDSRISMKNFKPSNAACTKTYPLFFSRYSGFKQTILRNSPLKLWRNEQL